MLKSRPSYKSHSCGVYKTPLTSECYIICCISGAGGVQAYAGGLTVRVEVTLL